ncbi:MAG: hypothetical protein VKL42_02730 [Snowella sp.]|nr:hypothetical protein [Snowella sp.]
MLLVDQLLAQRRVNRWLGLGILGLGLWIGLIGPLTAQESPVGICSQPLETLMARMLSDLPSYANRVIQRSKSSPDEMRGYVLLASQAEFDPLPLSSLQYQPIFPNTLHQVFFTTLERHYNDQKAYQLQNYYWAFFTQTDQGWQLSLLYSQLAALRKDDPPLPPIEAAQGAIGQAMQLWLRDCQAGAIPSSIKLPEQTNKLDNLEQTKNQ